MKISYNWLKTFIDLDLPLEEICEKLTMSGLEVEHIIEKESIRGGLKGLIVGEVLTKAKHPGADKLSLTTVSIGNETILPIVCGAPNVDVGQKVIIAPVGTELFDSDGAAFQIKKAKIRGEISEGMICGESEVGLGPDTSGIMVLGSSLPPGTPLKEVYEVETDHQIEIAIIPNRGDAISHLGVARELQALTGEKYKKPAIQSIDARGQMRVDVQIKDSKATPRYCGITITGISVKESPKWLIKKLESIDLKPINNIVDITNFVQHELGQPLHAFDYNKLNGTKIEARYARAGEKLVTLDEEDRNLNENHLIIADGETPIALAGVLGGLNSGVSESTSTIFIESAYFKPSAVRKTAKSFGLNTDASYRFERGTDPEMVDYALIRAVNLVLQEAGGEIASEVVDVYPEALEPVQIELKLDKLNSFIGHEIPKEKALEILQSLEIKVLANNGINLLLEVPRYRPDVLRPVDIYEEIIRVYGFNNIPIPPNVNYIPSLIDKNAPHKIKAKISNYLADIGFNEIMNNSQVPTNHYTNEELKDAVSLMNPLSSDMDVMRMELFNSAISTVTYNVNRKNHNLKFFEFGKTYFKTEGTYSEKEVLQITMSGSRHPEHWSEKSRKVREDELLAVVSNILKKLNIPVKKLKEVMRLYEVTQQQQKRHGLKQNMISLSIDWEACLNWTNDEIRIKEIPVFPIVRRDLSLVIDKKISYNEISKIAKQTLQNHLTDLLLFDVYEGKPLKENQKSFSVAFFLYDPKKTMEDKEIDSLMNKLMSDYEKQVQAFIRK